MRTEGEDNEPRQFSVWAPKSVALIGKLPATLEDRSILVRMRRKSKGEKVERLRLERLFVELRPWREKALRWAGENAAALRQADPTVPDGSSDRWVDNWRTVMAIAEAAG